MKPLSLYQRAQLVNTSFPDTLPLTVGLNKGKPFLSGYWFVGQTTVSSFYGSYPVEYLKRVNTMFPDCLGKQQTLHLFSGSLPPSPDYTRVGIDPTGQYKSDFECDAHTLSSYLPFKPSLIYSDPPYSVEDSLHYQNSMVNREIILRQCAAVLQPGGWVVWLDQCLPQFRNEELSLVGCISIIQSTSHRFRCAVLFQKPLR